MPWHGATGPSLRAGGAHRPGRRDAAHVRDVMIEGESGLLNLPVEAGRGPSGCRAPPGGVGQWGVAQAFSAEEADSLRGPQFGAAWCDEIAKWREAEAAFDMLQFGLRLGAGRAASSPQRRGRSR